MTDARMQAAITAFNHYLEKGIGRNAAAGIVGVLDFESALSPTAMNNSGTDKGGALNPKGAYGLAQWNGDRQTALALFAKTKGFDPALYTTQLDFVLTECANSFPAVWAAIQANGDVADFVTKFVREYENPASPAPEIAGALATARALLALPAPTPANAPPTPVPASPPPTLPDPEIAALEALYSILEPFDAKSRARMIAYLLSRTTP